ncbi:MAG TPA: arginyl-tRNA--protein transferase [Verrucomicrobium sp.]|nr:arginyl-tRNA--protein transferase [Verrucomicrobium sp.]
MLPPLIFDSAEAAAVPPHGMDMLWAKGWRHFGRGFFRYSITEHGGRWETILPLRIDLAKCELTKSQRRVLRRNGDLSATWAPAAITEETERLFQRHKARFKDNIPESLVNFLGPDPAEGPCQCLELQCRSEGRLVACSYLDIGHTSVSAVYGSFEPDDARRSPGILTLLLEIEWARQQGFRYHYPGYAMVGPSHYDYKKQFHGLEAYDWAAEEWRVVERSKQDEAEL